MKRLITAFIVCGVAQAIASIRPGASWNLRGDAYQEIEWTDLSQVKPTIEEVNQAVIDCQNAPAPATIEERIFALEGAVTTISEQTNVAVSLPPQKVVQ